MSTWKESLTIIELGDEKPSLMRSSCNMRASLLDLPVTDLWIYPSFGSFQRHVLRGLDDLSYLSLNHS